MANFNGTSGNDSISGTALSDIVEGSAGNDLISLKEKYDQINYPGSASDYTFTRGSGPTIYVDKPNGRDVLFDVEGVWFYDEAKWYDINDLILDGDDSIYGTSGNDVVDAGIGDDKIYLGEGYDQVDYDGSASEYRFRLQSDGTISVQKPDENGRDTLQSVEGIWFKGEEKWYDINDLLYNAPNDMNNWIYGTDGEDVIDASGGGDFIDLREQYDQVNYPGSASEYQFKIHEHQGVIVFKPNGSSDLLENVEGLWFSAEKKWYSLEDLALKSTDGDDRLKGSYQNETVEGSLGNDIIDLAGTNLNSGEEKARYDQINYGGSASEYTFSRGEGEFITVVKPDGAGVDQIRGVDGFWFYGEEEWYSLEELLQNDQQASASDDGAFI